MWHNMFKTTVLMNYLFVITRSMQTTVVCNGFLQENWDHYISVILLIIVSVAFRFRVDCYHLILHNHDDSVVIINNNLTFIWKQRHLACLTERRLVSSPIGVLFECKGKDTRRQCYTFKDQCSDDMNLTQLCVFV